MDSLTLAQKAKLRREIAALRGEAPSEAAGELNVIPFLDIITNVMMFVLASLAIAFTTTLEVHAPHRKGTSTESQSLTVMIVNDGYVLADRAQTVATIPRIAGEPSSDGKIYDAAGLTRSAHLLKQNAPDAKQIIVTANPNVPMQEIVRAMTALKEDYPDVLLAVVH